MTSTAAQIARKLSPAMRAAMLFDRHLGRAGHRNTNTLAALVGRGLVLPGSTYSLGWTALGREVARVLDPTVRTLDDIHTEALRENLGLLDREEVPDAPHDPLCTERCCIPPVPAVAAANARQPRSRPAAVVAPQLHPAPIAADPCPADLDKPYDCSRGDACSVHSVDGPADAQTVCPGDAGHSAHPIGAKSNCVACVPARQVETWESLRYPARCSDGDHFRCEHSGV